MGRVPLLDEGRMGQSKHVEGLRKDAGRHGPAGGASSLWQGHLRRVGGASRSPDLRLVAGPAPWMPLLHPPVPLTWPPRHDEPPHGTRITC